MKTARQEKILAIIEREAIETQNQLMEALAREGVKSTQATVTITAVSSIVRRSRD